jgi:peptidoglycan/LPS O-acetylase OafA/YrhL
MKPWANVGAYGVELFFIISGFIMVTTSWNAFGQPDASRRFILRRFARIYPPVWIVSTFLLMLYLANPHAINAHGSGHIDFLASFLLLPQKDDPLLTVTWTLEFEMFFYLVFALALLFPRRSFPIFAGTWAALTILGNLLFRHSANAYLAFLGIPLPLEFLAGVLVGTFILRGKIRAPWTFTIGGTLIMLTAIFAHDRLAALSPEIWPVWIQVLLAIPLGALLYGIVCLERNGKLILPKSLDALGDASYAIYLWHVPVLGALGLVCGHLHVHGILGHLAFITIAFAAVIAWSLIFYHSVERPLTRYLNGLIGRPAALPQTTQRPVSTTD